VTSDFPSRAFRILHLEDNSLDGELVAEFLREAALPVTIHRVWTREDFTREVTGDYDLILADHQLPNFSGDEALDIARDLAPGLPFIFVSGTLGEEIAVEALKRGATDYVVKQRLGRLPSVVTRTLAELKERLQRHDVEQALMDSERELRLALQAGRFGAWSLDFATRTLKCSDLCRRNFGREPADPFSYDDLVDAIHPDDRNRMLDAVQKSVLSGNDYDIEYRVITPSGEVRWIGIRGQPIYDSQGRAERIMGVSVDIDSRKRGELFRRALIDLEDRFRRLDDPVDLAFAAAQMLGETLEIGRAGYGTVDPDAETITIDRDWTATGVRTLAGTLQFRDYGSYIEDLKRGTTVVFADATQDERARAGAEALRAIQALSVVNLPIIEQGRIRALFYLNHPQARRWRDDELAFLREVASRTRAVVERRRAEQGLRESERNYRYAAELNPQVPWTATPDGRVETMSPRWEEWTGHEGKDDTWARALVEEDVAAAQQTWARSLATGEPYDIIYRLRMRDGEARFVRSRAFPRRGEDGRIIRWYGTTEDVHEEKLLEQALADFNRELERRVEQRTHELTLAQEALRQSQKLEAIGQLTGGVAHDFNNLLTPIVGSLDLLQRRRLGGEREQRLIESALQSAERAKTLVQRLLAFARRQPLRSGPVDVGDLIRGMADLVSSTCGPQVRLAVEIEPQLASAIADANQLEMALLNLCVNARDAMPQGGDLTLSAANAVLRDGGTARLKPGRYVRITVADTGSGMDEATLARAIEPFFSTKGIGKGTGLGLSMVHGLASQLGGDMTIASTPGRGTAVTLMLPAADHAAAAADGQDGAAPADLARGIALLVDDEDLVRESTAEMLGDMGYHVVEATSAERALKMVEEGLAFDLLVTDHLMPGMSGVELARAIRARHPGLPVLIISGYADTDTIAPDLPRLAKPFRRGDLADSLALRH
jgi:PAS domain S-box-containing protein